MAVRCRNKYYLSRCISTVLLGQVPSVEVLVPAYKDMQHRDHGPYTALVRPIYSDVPNQ